MLREWGRVYKLVSLLLVFFLLGSIVSPSLAWGSSREELIRKLQEAQRKLDSLNKEMERTESDLLKVQREEQFVSSELAKLEKDLEIALAELAQVEAELALAEERLEQTNEELEAAQEELENRNRLLHNRIRSIYEQGTVTYLEVLFNAHSVSDLLHRFNYLKMIVEQDVKILQDVREYRALVEDKKAQAEQEKADIVALRLEVENKKRDLEVKVASRERQLDQLQMSAKDYEQALEDQEKLSEEFGKQLQEYQKELDAMGVPVFQWPVNTRSFWISSYFGSRYHPILKTYRHHSGLDLAAAQGTPVYAAESGIIYSSGWLGGYGLTITIAHGQTYSTLYAHLSASYVKVGQEVKKGDLIGRVGSTGLSTGPHLHFEIRENGNPQDPLKFLPPR